MRERAKFSSGSRFYGVVAGEVADYSYILPIKRLRALRLLFLFFLTHNLPFSYTQFTQERFLSFFGSFENAPQFSNPL